MATAMDGLHEQDLTPFKQNIYNNLMTMRSKFSLMICDQNVLHVVKKPYIKA